MNGLGTVYVAINRIIEAARDAVETFKFSEDNLAAHPTSVDAKRSLAIAQVMLDEAIQNARDQFMMAITDGISQMRIKNKARQVDDPSNAQINILSALQMIPHPSDEFLYAVANTLKGNRLALMAMDAIVRAAWADVPDHECRTYSDMLKPVMSIQAADDAITKLKKLCDKIQKEDPKDVAQREQYRSTDDLVVRELGVDPQMFHEAIDMF